MEEILRSSHRLQLFFLRFWPLFAIPAKLLKNKQLWRWTHGLREAAHIWETAGLGYGKRCSELEKTSLSPRALPKPSRSEQPPTDRSGDSGHQPESHQFPQLHVSDTKGHRRTLQSEVTHTETGVLAATPSDTSPLCHSFACNAGRLGETVSKVRCPELLARLSLSTGLQGLLAFSLWNQILQSEGRLAGDLQDTAKPSLTLSP